MSNLNSLGLQRGAEHLHRLGPRAIPELLAEVAQRTGDDAPSILDLLTEAAFYARGVAGRGWRGGS
jgi:hypothetical protein